MLSIWVGRLSAVEGAAETDDDSEIGSLSGKDKISPCADREAAKGMATVSSVSSTKKNIVARIGHPFLLALLTLTTGWDRILLFSSYADRPINMFWLPALKPSGIQERR
ncbi:hypothetical protein SDC9_181140 [bioreactor metagenome]|uniref:Uncharacterized protein n=1 Tax=bioreactor metagenome TaxID=1076179 RepID=A0A645H4P0_9ZZZZ